MDGDELRRMIAEVEPRRGWDFSRMRVDRDPAPWGFLDVARRYLRPTDRVLDVGTGGGEKFLSLADAFGMGIGVDPDPAMIATARENTPPALAERVSFIEGSAEALPVPDASCDVVLNRHAVVGVTEVTRVLRPGGYFLTQQVGVQNTFNIATLFGAGPGMGGEAIPPEQEVPALTEAFQRRAFALIAYGTYNVPYYFKDVESLLFWMRAIGIPPDLDADRHWRDVNYLVAEYTTPRGIETNEHRELLIVRAPSA
jgi:SAM-dependent methyltransferase